MDKEAEIARIKAEADARNREIDRQHRNAMAKLYGGAALQIGSALIPGTLGLKGAGAAIKAITPYVGKKIAENVATGTISGLASGAVEGIGRGLMDGENPWKTMVSDGAIGALLGGPLGLVGGKVAKLIDENALAKGNKLPQQYFDEYVAGLKGDPNTTLADNTPLFKSTPYEKEASKALKVVRAQQFGVNPNSGTREIALDQYMYHGTPVDNTYTDFDLNYLQSGEGANMYGSGIYGAKDVEVANKNYRYMRNDEPITYKGKPLMDLYDALERQTIRLNPKEAQKIYDKMALIEDLEYKGMYNSLNDDYFSPEVRNWYINEIEPYVKMPGNLYKVRIPDNEYFLDFTKNFEEQSPYVKSKLKDYFDLEPSNYTEGTGEDLYHYITNKYAENDPKKASEMLNNAGIKGNRYIGDRDGESFVIFNPENASIVDAYMGDKKTTQFIRENAYNKFSDAIIKEGNSKSLADIKIPSKEYARVSKAINSNEYPLEFQNEINFPLTLSNDRTYLIENNGGGNFRIITKKAIDNGTTFFD